MRTLVWIFAPAVLLAQINVPYERIRDADKEPGNWLTYSRDYSGQRYSPLDQINAGNVGKLHMAWMRQVNEMDTFETSPIVVDGTMFITVPPNVVEALDGGTGRTLWSYRKDLPSDSTAVLRQSESRPGDSGRYALLRQHRRAPDRARRAHGQCALGRDHGRLQDRLLQHGRAAGGEGQDHHRNGGRRVWHARDSSTATMLIPANGCGASTRSPPKANPGTKPGRAIAGKPARPQRG